LWWGVLGLVWLGFLGPAFGDGDPFLFVFAVGFGFNAVCGPVGYLLMLSGNERSYLKILFVCNSFGLAIQCMLIPLIGAIGAAIGSAAALVASGIWARMIAVEKIGVDPTLFSLIAPRHSQEK